MLVTAGPVKTGNHPWPGKGAGQNREPPRRQHMIFKDMAGMSLSLQRCGPGLVAESFGRESPGVPEVGVGPAAGMQTHKVLVAMSDCKHHGM